MFSCACSLRSTQCAALLALAGAAGIARMEPVREMRSPVVPLSQQVEVGIDSSDRHPASRFDATIATFAHSAQLVEIVHEMMAELNAAEVETHPLDTTPPRVVASPPAVVPSARDYAFPYAVGPPSVRHTLTARADDTFVSGDSAARRMSVSRFAPVQFALVCAPSPRTPDTVRVTTSGLPEAEFRPARRAGGFPLLLSAAPSRFSGGRPGGAILPVTT